MDQHRVLGIDYGTVRIGLSVSDPLGIIAQPLQTIANNAEFWEQLNAVIATQHVHRIVIGMPFNLKGQKGQKAQEVEKFIERLKQHTDCEVVLWDERFTSAIAQRTMRALGTKKSERQKKGRIDSMAAAVMLQSFLDSTKRSMSC